MIKEYKNLSIAKKVLIVLLSNSIIPIIFIGFIMCFIGINILESKTDALIESNMRLAQQGLEDYFKKYNRLMLSIYNNDDYADYLSKLNIWDTKSYNLKKYQLQSDLQNIAYNDEDILGIAIVTNRKEMVYFDSITLSNTNSNCFPEDDKEIKSIIAKINEETNTIYSNIVKIKDENNEPKNVMYLSHRLVNVENYSKGIIGSIIICISEDDIRKIYFQDNISNGNITLICNSNGEIISSSTGEFIGKSLLDDVDDYSESVLKNKLKENNIIKSRNVSIYNKNIKDGEFFLINIREKNYLFKEGGYIIFIITLAGVITALISAIVAVGFSNYIKASVRKIINGMNQAVEGNYNVQIPMDKEDEFGEISKNFNHMINEVNKYLIKEKNALIREKNAEIKALESQINPHFLYNTLDTINWMAIENEEFKISKMLNSLATILRYSIDRSNKLTTIERELIYINKYIYLQQQRFEYPFKYILDIDEDVLEFKIHKLLFQPLIENSIIHAFSREEIDNELLISIKRRKNELVEIVVADNGSGMEEVLVKKFNDLNYEDLSLENSIGVCNVIMRVKHYYDNRGKVFIQSNRNGTRIQISIPIE